MISEVLKSRIKELNLSVPQAAKRCGIPPSTLYSYVTYNTTPSSKILKKISDGLNITLNDLLKETLPPSTRASKEIPFSGKESMIQVPVVGEIHAGQPVVADENIQRYTCVYADKSLEGQLFGLEVKGDSMSPDISSGETCIVKKEISADDGDIVVALVNHEEVVIRKFFHSSGTIILQASNQTYPPILIRENEQFRIVGVVMFCQRRFK